MPRGPLLSRTVSIAALAALAVATSTACKRKAEEFPIEPPTESWETFPMTLPAPEAPVTDLLEGLKAGDTLQGAKVMAVGGVSKDGGIPINVLMEREGLQPLAAQIVVHTRSEDPRPPAWSAKYAVFYHMLGPFKPPMPGDIKRMIDEVAERLKRTEDKVPMPGGMKPARRPGSPA